MKNLIVFAIVMLIIIITQDISWADVPAPALPSGPAQAPIDGGLGLLALGGGAYALKKLRSKK